MILLCILDIWIFSKLQLTAVKSTALFSTKMALPWTNQAGASGRKFPFPNNHGHHHQNLRIFIWWIFCPSWSEFWWKLLCWCSFQGFYFVLFLWRQFHPQGSLDMSVCLYIYVYIYMYRRDYTQSSWTFNFRLSNSSRSFGKKQPSIPASSNYPYWRDEKAMQTVHCLGWCQIMIPYILSNSFSLIFTTWHPSQQPYYSDISEKFIPSTQMFIHSTSMSSSTNPNQLHPWSLTNIAPESHGDKNPRLSSFLLGFRWFFFQGRFPSLKLREMISSCWHQSSDRQNPINLPANPCHPWDDCIFTDPWMVDFYSTCR